LIKKAFKQGVKISEVKGDSLEVAQGAYYFCPKRFNRFPRFTIFLRKDKVGTGIYD
jgi:hypothetical protein